jgi:hypothetical protein
MIVRLRKVIDAADALPKVTRAAARGDLGQAWAELLPSRHPGGLLRIDAARAKAEKNLDSKYPLRLSDPKMTAEDIALGYKQLLESSG